MEPSMKIEPIESAVWEKSNENTFEDIMKTIVTVDTDVWEKDERTHFDEHMQTELLKFELNDVGEAMISKIEIMDTEDHLVEDDSKYLVDQFVDGDGKTWVMKGDSFVENSVSPAQHKFNFSYMCKICDYNADCKDSLNSHIDSVHSTTDDGESYSVQDLFSKWSDHVTPKVDQCKRPFSNYDIDYAMLELQSLKCNLCSYHTVFKGNLTRHFNKRHLKTKEFVCHLCNYTTSLESQLDYHITTKHMVSILKKRHKETVKCNLCNFTFLHRDQLKDHLKIKHRDLMMHKCVWCIYSTKDKEDLDRHIKDTHIEKYLCDLCGYVAVHGNTLENHMRSHRSTLNYLGNLLESCNKNKNCLLIDLESGESNDYVNHIDSSLDDHTYSLNCLGTSVCLADHTYTLKSSWKYICRDIFDRVVKNHKCSLCDHSYSSEMCIFRQERFG